MTTIHHHDVENYDGTATSSPTEYYDPALMYSDLTDAQNIIMVVLTIPPGILSILGSSTILYSIWKRHIQPQRDKKNNSSTNNNNNSTTNANNNNCTHNSRRSSSTPKCGPYERILMTLSALDILFTLVFMLQSILTPRDDVRVTSIGSNASCQVLGALWQFCLSNFYFSGLLAYYYLRTIVSGWTDQRFGKQEPYWMAAGLLWYSGTAVLGLVMEWYDVNEIGIGCWVNNVPRNCGEDAWDSGEPCISVYIAWLFGGIQIVFLFCFVAVANVVIFCHVRRTMARSRQWSFRRNMGLQRRQQPQQPQEQQPHAQSTQLGQERLATLANSAPNTTTRRRPDARVQQVAVQCALYVAAFWVTALPTLVVRNLEGFNFQAADESQIYPLLVIQSILAPLVGFLNMLVYFRPRYLRIREEFPTKSRYWAFRRAISDQYGRSEISLSFTTSRADKGATTSNGPTTQVITNSTAMQQHRPSVRLAESALDKTIPPLQQSSSALPALICSDEDCSSTGFRSSSSNTRVETEKEVHDATLTHSSLCGADTSDALDKTENSPSTESLSTGCGGEKGEETFRDEAGNNQCQPRLRRTTTTSSAESNNSVEGQRRRSSTLSALSRLSWISGSTPFSSSDEDGDSDGQTHGVDESRWSNNDDEEKE